MSFKFTPDWYFDSFEMADKDFFLKNNIKGILLDIDNTLEPYEHPTPSDHVYRWFEMLDEIGVRAAFVSNNNQQRVVRFNEKLGLPYYAKAKKPFSKNLRLAMKTIGTFAGETVFMGDQIFTDVWAAHNAGIRAILVPPIHDKRDLLTKFKRALERPIMKKYRKERSK